MNTRLLLCVLGLSLSLPLLAQDPPAAPAQCVVVVGLHWPDHDLSHAQVRVFRDQARRDLVEAFPATDAGGKVVMALPAGTYYVTAVVDINNDGQLNAGDGLGFHGVEDPATEQPQPLEVKEKASAFWLTVSLTMGADGKLAPTGVRKPAPAAAAPRHTLSGVVSGGSGAPTLVYLVPASGRGDCFAAQAGADGAFRLTYTDGQYYVFAIQDANRSEGADRGDLFAVQGYAAEQGRTFPTVQLAGDLADQALKLEWRVSDTGLLKHLETQADGPQVALGTLPAIILGQVTGSDQPAGSARIAGDAGFVGEVARVPLTNGQFIAAVPAGVYYVNAMTGAAADTRPAAGDRVAFYGVSDLRKAHGPQPLALKPGEVTTIRLQCVARLDEQMRPNPLENEPGQ